MISAFVTNVTVRGAGPLAGMTCGRARNDETVKRVFLDTCEMFQDLTLERRRSERVPPDMSAGILAEQVVKGKLVLTQWDHAVEQWIMRVNCLARWCPELGVPSIGEADRKAMIEQVCLGAVSHKEIREKSVWPAVRGWLSDAQRSLVEKHAPERLNLPNGRKAKLTYSAEAPPQIAMRIQELYGVNGPLRIAMGRAPVVVQVLGPNQRPVQVTQDLAGFWRDTYPKVKQELQRKYPKHEWR